MDDRKPRRSWARLLAAGIAVAALFAGGGVVLGTHLTSGATGQRVFVVGAVVGGADKARLIIIRG